MTNSLRILNRIVLFLVGLGFIAGGGVAVAAGIPNGQQPAWLSTAMTWLRDNVLPLAEQTVTISSYNVLLWVVVALAACGVVVVLLLMYSLTRGRGKTGTAERDKQRDGSTVVDRSVAAGIITDPLADRSDILTARTTVFESRAGRALEVSVTPRRGARLEHVMHAIDDRIETWDQFASEKQPVLIHIRGRGALNRLRSVQRVR